MKERGIWARDCPQCGPRLLPKCELGPHRCPSEKNKKSTPPHWAAFLYEAPDKDLGPTTESLFPSVDLMKQAKIARAGDDWLALTEEPTLDPKSRSVSVPPFLAFP
jgi:hypothetical protein